ncbi:hypothetical protein, partial [Cronobacter sakazakii]|uniref:hypothetical protein n=1 Tax=Cronobacter sakazakii TaxID=28141 RepID=UPI001956721A
MAKSERFFTATFELTSNTGTVFALDEADGRSLNDSPFGALMVLPIADDAAFPASSTDSAALIADWLACAASP